MSESLVNRLSDQLQSYRGEEVEALIVGANGKHVELYSVDVDGRSRLNDDVGFAAIGIGAWHARSSLMQAGYRNSSNFAPALAAVFAAKKVAETAPGVGTFSDIHVALKDRIVRLPGPLDNKLQELYTIWQSQWRDITFKAIADLQAFLDQQGDEGQTDDKPETIAGGNAQPNARPREDAPKASREHEAQQELKGGNDQGGESAFAKSKIA